MIEVTELFADTYALGLAVVLACRRGDEAGVRLLTAGLPAGELPTFRWVVGLYADAPGVSRGSFADVSDERVRAHLLEVTAIEAGRAAAA